MLQVQDQSLRPLTTAHLAQTMSLLALSNLELKERVLTEIASNPALEMLDDRVCPSCHRPLAGKRSLPGLLGASGAGRASRIPLAARVRPDLRRSLDR
jgi:DNA-directed RNA polymerase specialized sigma54-like protein